MPRDADDDTIKKAYRKAALRLHPDKCQLEGSKEAFQKLSSAFGCLSDSNERAYYDRTGKERGAAGSASNGTMAPLGRRSLLRYQRRRLLLRLLLLAGALAPHAGADHEAHDGADDQRQH